MRLRGLLPAVLAATIAGCGDDHPAGPPKAEVRSLSVSGSPFQMGEQHGKALADEIRDSIRRRIPVAFSAAGEDAGDPAFLESACRSYVAAIKPRLPESVREELRGIASGARVAEDDVLLLDVQREGLRWHGANPRLLHAALASPPAEGEDAEKEVVAAFEGWRGDSVEGSMLLLHRSPEGGRPTLVLTWAGGLGALAGVSPVLVAAQGEVPLSREQATLAGPTFGIGFRVALERANSLEDFVARLPRLSGNRVLVADRGGRRHMGVLSLAEDPDARDHAPREWVLAPAGLGAPDDPRTIAQEEALGAYPRRPTAKETVPLALAGRVPGGTGPLVRVRFTEIVLRFDGSQETFPFDLPR